METNLPNLRHLAALLAVSESGSISATSDLVHLSQPAITQGLNRIEAALGTALFERSGKGVSLTPAGELFLARVQRALGFLQSFSRELKPARPWQQLFTSAQLRAVIAVVEHGNLSTAAAELGLAQPTVHRAAREAEAACGQTLFLRRAAGVDATATARRLARLASQAFAELRQAYEEVAEHLGQMNGSVRVGSLPLARTDLVPNAVTALLARHPQAQVSVVDGPYEELLDMLLHGRVDMIVGALRQPPPVREVEQRALFDDELAVVARAGHPLLQRKHLQLETLAALDWVAPRQGTPARKRFTALFAEQQLRPPDRLIECSSSVATRALLLQSDRIALLSARQVLPDIRAGLLATLAIRLGAFRSIGLTLRQGWQPTSVQAAYLDLLERSARAPDAQTPCDLGKTNGT